MKRSFARIFLLGIFLFSFSLPLLLPVPAEGALIVCGTYEDHDPADNVNTTDTCTMCHLIFMGSQIIKWLMQIMTIVAIAAIFAMGILYIISAGNDGLMQTAKRGIWAALIGFAVILGAWLIVNIVLTVLADTNKGPLAVEGFQQTGVFSFECNARSSAGSATPGGTSGVVGTGSGGGNGGGGGAQASCENINTAKTRLSGGGNVCNNTGTCPRCNTEPFQGLIQKYASQYGISQGLIKGIIARESSCNPREERAESDGTRSCGLMQVNINSSSFSCAQLQDPETGIKEGVRILAAAKDNAERLTRSYGNTVTVNQLMAAIHNAGLDQSGLSVDCNPSSGWPTIPKWGCPINPGSAEFNACAIRDYACDVGACN